jgi:hypothetical protein
MKTAVADRSPKSEEMDAKEVKQNHIHYEDSVTQPFALNEDDDDDDDVVQVLNGATSDCEPNLSLSNSGTTVHSRSKPRYDSAFDDDDNRGSLDMVAQTKTRTPRVMSFKESSVEYLERKRSEADLLDQPRNEVVWNDQASSLDKTGSDDIALNHTTAFDSTLSTMETYPILTDEGDWNRTVTTEPGSDILITPSKVDDVKRRADDYEREAAKDVFVTPSRAGDTMYSLQSKGSNTTFASYASPFQTLNDGSISDGYVNSLALSDSIADELTLSQSNEI